MSVERSAAALIRSVGLLADGPGPWGRPIAAPGPGVFVVEMPSPPASPPIELTAVGDWITRVESLRLDGERPTSRQLATRLASFWLPSSPVLYIGASERSVAKRVAALWTTTLGDRRPHPGGHWLRALRGLEGARIWWASTPAVEEYEDALFGAFLAGVDDAERAALHDPDTVMPFANLRAATGERRRTGLTGALIAEPIVTPDAPRHLVVVPDGDAEGAHGEGGEEVRG